MTRVIGHRVFRRAAQFVPVAALLSFLFFVTSFVNAPTPYTLRYPATFGGRFQIPAENPTTEEGVRLGRMLFYEKRLSQNNTLSCESCHEQSRAFTDGRTFSVGVDGSLTRRNSMSLANLLWVRNFFWDGRSEGLENQAVFPLTDAHEMGQALTVSADKLKHTSVYPALFKEAFGTEDITPERITKALAQFERTLISADSRYDRYLAGSYQPTASEARGMLLFENGPASGIRGANCGHCHGGPKTFKELFHNNGLDSVFADAGREEHTKDAGDRGRFRVPTLRNIALTAPYMHDGRFASLDEVLDHYNEHIVASSTLSSFLEGVSNQAGGQTLGLNVADKQDIKAFLHMLTDSTFIKNPEFSNPHISKQP